MAEGKSRPERRWELAFAAVDLLTAALVAASVFLGLPARWWPVDLGAGVVIAVLLGAGVGLAIGAPLGRPLAKIGSGVTLALGLALLTMLALTVSYLAGIYGPVGRGGALILLLIAALALPYLVALPAAQLAWLGRSAKKGGG
jgi:hypothetical protein